MMYHKQRDINGTRFYDWVFNDGTGGVMGVTASESTSCDCGVPLHYSVAIRGSDTNVAYAPSSAEQAKKVAELFAALADGKIPDLGIPNGF